MDLEKWESISGCMDSSCEEAVWQALARWVEEGEAGKVVPNLGPDFEWASLNSGCDLCENVWWLFLLRLYLVR